MSKEIYLNKDSFLECISLFIKNKVMVRSFYLVDAQFENIDLDISNYENEFFKYDGCLDGEFIFINFTLSEDIIIRFCNQIHEGLYLCTFAKKAKYFFIVTELSEVFDLLPPEVKKIIMFNFDMFNNEYTQVE